MAIARFLLKFAVLFATIAGFPLVHANEIATINAFDALLSFPQTQPEDGWWNHVAPNDFDVEDGEAGLIRYLAKQKKKGMDVNQTRHTGTMLHHAIRGGMNKAALWLITNGADPLKSLEGLEGQNDALTIAVQYRRWPVIDALLKLPKFTTANRTSKHLYDWRAAYGKDEQIAIGELLERRVTLPTGTDGEILLYEALQANWMKLVLALADAGVTRAFTGGSPYGMQPQTKNALAISDIKAADSRLAAPVFPHVISHLSTTGDVTAIWHANLRLPFHDQVFARDVILRTLAPLTAQSVQRAVLERIPRDVLRAALEDEKIFGPWVRWAVDLPEAECEWALAALDGLLKKRTAALLITLVKDTTYYRQNQQSVNADAGWARLLSKLSAPLPPETSGKLWMFVPNQSRETLLKLGYRPSGEELSAWLAYTTEDLVRALWPQLKSAMPEIAERIHENLLEPFNASARGGCDSSGIRSDVWEMAQTLLDGGARPRKPAMLDAGCRALTDPEILAALEKAGMIAPALAVNSGRFVLATDRCRFTPNALWRRALLKDRALPGRNPPESVRIEGIQTIDVPGEAECALLVWGGSAGGREFIDEDGFTGMNRLTPCADGNYATAIWRNVGGTIRQLVFDNRERAVQGVQALRYTKSGAQFFLAGGIELGGCGQTPSILLTWNHAPGTEPTLRTVPREHEVMQALLRQCGSAKMWDCFANGAPESEASPSEYSFIDQQWATDRKVFLDAILALDYDALRAARKAGIFPRWIAQAIAAVSQSNLSPAEKRRRIAWLFRDAEQLKAAIGEGYWMDALIPWLPMEDWTPIIKILKGSPSMLENLRYDADRQGKKNLACRFATAMQRSCGVTNREDTPRE